jgi:hypothetical protein
VTSPRAGVWAGLVGVVAAIAVAVSIQAGGPAMNDPDSAASVLYFRTITGGQPLETFVATTPKPLLTLVYGLSWTLTGDWRVLGWLTIAVFGVAVACGTELAQRVAGRAAAAFVAVAMTLSPVLALEVSRANSVVWAIAGWLVAGLALSASRPRAWLAGVALLVAFLSRTETIVLLGPATVWIVALAMRGRAPEARRLAPLLLAWLALPIACIHDLVLTGDPLYWLSAPAGYTALVAPDLRPLRPLELIGEVVSRYAGMPILALLGIVGVARLAGRRHWPALGAIACLTGGVVVLLVVIAWRGVYVTTRYLEQADIGLLVAAAIGAGWLAELAGSAVASRLAARSRPNDGEDRARAFGPAVAVAVAVVIAAVVATRDLAAPLGGGLAAELERVRTTSRNADLVRPRLAAILAAAPGSAPAPVEGPPGLTVVDTRRATILVPRTLVNRLLVDLDAPLTTLADSWLAIRGTGALDAITAGQVIYHDRAGDLRPELFGPLEIDGLVATGAVTIVPLFTDPAAGIWILEASAP